MKKIIIKILLRLLGNPYYHPLSKEAVDALLTTLSKEEGLERLPAFLEQCATQYRNQYLYSGNEIFKGAVLAFTSLRQQILEKRNPKKKKDLTEKQEGGKIKTASY